MSSCYNFDIDNIHLLGESSGEHLVLNYAATNADPNIVKSIISLYAPTNLKQFYDSLISPPIPYACNSLLIFPSIESSVTNCTYNNILHTFYQFPYYWAENTAITIYTQNYRPNSCTVLLLPNILIYRTDNVIKSMMAKWSPSSSDLTQISPAYLTNTGDIPVFIIHGDNDLLVPYGIATENMEDVLNSNGGILIQSSICPTTSFPTLTQRHLIRIYKGVNHGMTVKPSATFQTDVYNRTRSDIVDWFNEH